MRWTESRYAGRVTRSRCRIQCRDVAVWGDSATGCVATPHGFVEVYAENNKARGPWLTLRVIMRGREYFRRYKGKWSPRGIAIAAGRFARALGK